MVPIQAKYFDFIMWRFSRSILFANSANLPVQVRNLGSGGTGIKKQRVVAIIASFDVAEVLQVPEKLKGWKNGEEMPSENLSTLEEGGGSSIREGQTE